jgi:hypothetical protein
MYHFVNNFMQDSEGAFALCGMVFASIFLDTRRIRLDKA